MTVVAPKIHPHDVTRVTSALIASLLTVVDGSLPHNTPLDVDYILYKPSDIKHVKITLLQNATKIQISYTLENGDMAVYNWRKNQFNTWVCIGEINQLTDNGPKHWLLTSMDEVRSLTHAVLVVRGLLRDSDE